MRSGEAPGFELDRKIDSESRPVMWLGLCELRIMDDRRWPWLILVPQRAGVEEIHDLTPLDQAMLTFETNTVAQALKALTGCTKINTAALGNVVRQLHVHVIARSEGDPGWPGPVWGFGLREPYRREDLHRLVDRIRTALSDPKPAN
jgi:diadenosine tetraphosphate (Ap4A) HIT family hydrolase